MKIQEKLSRNSESHKGQNGKILVLGGSQEYTGAPALSAQASLRAGADLVKVLTADDAKPVVAAFSEDLIVEGYGDRFDKNSLDKAFELEEWADITILGPGLSNFESDALREFAENAGKLVMDAAAIETCRETSGNIFTPHQREAEVLRQGYKSIEEFALDKDNTVVVTGPEDRIIGKEVTQNFTGCAGMTVGGTGDVLTGITAALWAQNLERREAAELAAWTNGKAGERAYERLGEGMTASDMLKDVSKVLFVKE